MSYKVDESTSRRLKKMTKRQRAQFQIDQINEIESILDKVKAQRQSEL